MPVCGIRRQVGARRIRSVWRAAFAPTVAAGLLTGHEFAQSVAIRFCPCEVRGIFDNSVGIASVSLDRSWTFARSFKDEGRKGRYTRLTRGFEVRITFVLSRSICAIFSSLLHCHANSPRNGWSSSFLHLITGFARSRRISANGKCFSEVHVSRVGSVIQLRFGLLKIEERVCAEVVGECGFDFMNFFSCGLRTMRRSSLWSWKESEWKSVLLTFSEFVFSTLVSTEFQSCEEVLFFSWRDSM